MAFRCHVATETILTALGWRSFLLHAVYILTRLLSTTTKNTKRIGDRGIKREIEVKREQEKEREK